MKIHLTVTSGGFLVPTTDEDFEQKKKLKYGETYEVTIKLARNLEFHRKYFSMMHCAWDMLPQNVRDGFKGFENFRKYMQMTAGYTETFFSPQYGMFLEGPASIAFDKMKQEEFEELYTKVRAIVDKLVTRYVPMEEFERTLLNY